MTRSCHVHRLQANPSLARKRPRSWTAQPRPARCQPNKGKQEEPRQITRNKQKNLTQWVQQQNNMPSHNGISQKQAPDSNPSRKTSDQSHRGAQVLTRQSTTKVKILVKTRDWAHNQVCRPQHNLLQRLIIFLYRLAKAGPNDSLEPINKTTQKIGSNRKRAPKPTRHQLTKPYILKLHNRLPACVFMFYSILEMLCFKTSSQQRDKIVLWLHWQTGELNKNNENKMDEC